MRDEGLPTLRMGVLKMDFLMFQESSEAQVDAVEHFFCMQLQI